VADVCWSFLQVFAHCLLQLNFLKSLLGLPVLMSVFVFFKAWTFLT